ncbi:MAG: hypothetical protein U9O96_06785 [Candidatus Thermoplasmatota archaeon]|nr:hypothetical protein [Candidatus Thermoplasmatota archaeon]
MKKFVAFIVSFLLISSVFGIVVSSRNEGAGEMLANSEKINYVYGDKSNENTKEVKSDCIHNVEHVKCFGDKKLNILPKMFEAYIHTEYEDVKKNVSILYGLLLPIDVDNNSGTGENGKDIKVRFYILPSLSHENFGWVLSFYLVVEVERLGEELKNEDFEIYLNFYLSLENYDYGTHEFRLGYASAEGKELPKDEKIIFTIYPYLMYDKSPDFVLQNIPTFDGEESDIDLIASYSGDYGDNVFHHKVVITYQPAVSSTIKFTPDLNLRKINIALSRTASKDTMLTIAYTGGKNGEDMDIALTIDKIPEEMSFSIFYSLSGVSGERGMVIYESSSEFNVTLTIKIKMVGLLGRVQYLPKYFMAKWANKIYGGHINLNTSSSSTKFIICDNIDNPSIYFSISNVTNIANFSWGIDQEGYVKFDAEHEGPMIDFYWIMDSVRIELISQLKTNYFSLSWNIDQEGHVNLDTDGKWLNTFSFNFTLDGYVGLLIGASFLKADDFRAEWVVWPPSFNISGDINFIGDIIFSVMLDGTWYFLPLR